MTSQVFVLAFIAALYPLGLLAITVLLHSARPKALGSAFFAGAAVCLLSVGVLVLVVLRNLDLDSSSSSNTRNGLRLGVGIALVLLGLIVARRPKRPQQDSSWKRRLESPKLRSVFVAGVLLYGPSATYVAAVEQLGTTQESGAATALALVLIVVIVLLTVELPLLAYLVWPERTAARIAVIEHWLDEHGQAVFAAVLVILGAIIAVESLVAIID